MRVKRIWNVVTKALLLCTIMVSVVACSADMDMSEEPFGNSERYIIAFGMLDSDEWEIVTDDDARLRIVELGSRVTEDDIASHEGRTLFNYTINRTRNGVAEVRLNCFYPLEVKDLKVFDSEEAESKVVATVEETPEWKDENFVSLLKDAAMLYEVSVGGGYINVNVCTTSVSAEEACDVELYYDSHSSTDKMAVLQLVCEAEGTNTLQVEYRWLSFRITDEISAMLADATTYTFYWCWWNEVGNPEAGVKEYTSVMNVNTSNSQMGL